MRFTKTLMAVAALATISSGAAKAADAGFDPLSCMYVRGDIGVTFSDLDIDGVTGIDSSVGWAPSAGIGCQFTDYIRGDVTFESAFGYENDQLGVTLDYSVYGGMANAYIDLPLGMFVPYIGAGVGYGKGEASVSSSGLTLSSNEWNLLWGGMVGTAIYVTQDIAVDVGYKYIQYVDSDGDLGNHMIRAGIRFGF